MTKQRQRHPNRNAQQDKKCRGKVKGVGNDPELGGGKVIKEKFQEERRRSIVPLSAKSEKQKIALQSFTKHQMTILSGSAGTGKSQLMCWWAAKLWLEGQVDNIIITRPNKSLDGDNAAVPGGDSQKILMYCMSMLMKFRDYLGPGILRNNLRMEFADSLFSDVRGILIAPTEKLQGMSFDSSTIILADEMQNATVGQIKSLTTRCEEGAQLIISGDPRQTAIGKRNGLSFLLKTLESHPTDQVGVVNFTKDEIVRGSMAGFFVRAYEEMGEQWIDD